MPDGTCKCLHCGAVFESFERSRKLTRNSQLTQRKENIMPSIEQVTRIDPATSFWLLRALDVAAQRDPIDALADAELLAQILRARLHTIQARN
jgi:hypothetical protein